MNEYFRRRVLARLLLASLAGLTTAAGASALEAALRRDVPARELLWEPRLAGPGPKTPPATNPPNPQPVPSPHPEPPKVPLETYDFEMVVPANGQAHLQARDFRIQGNPGVEYEILKVRYNANVRTQRRDGAVSDVALLFDQSSSVRSLGFLGATGSDPDGKRLEAAVRFLKRMPAGLRVGAFTFQSTANPQDTWAAVSGFGTDRGQTEQAIRQLGGKEGGGTPTYSALLGVIQELAKQPGSGQRSIVCFTDGAPDPNELAFQDQVVTAAKAAHVSIWFVALGGTDWGTNREIATKTDGKVIEVDSAEDLNAAFTRLARQFETQDDSSYRITARARKKGVRFQDRELLAPSVRRVRGNTAPQSYQLPVDLGRVNRSMVPAPGTGGNPGGGG